MDNGRDLIHQPQRDDAPALPPVLQLEAVSVPRVTVSAAVRRHWLTVLIPVVVLMALAVALAATRTPSFTAQTTLSIGDVSSTSEAALAGFTGATRAIADTYSRSIDRDEVVGRVARRLNADPEAIKAQVSAAPVPESSVMAVRAETSSNQGSVVLANEAADSLVRYSERAADSQERNEELLADYEEAVIELEQARVEAEAARETFAALETPKAEADFTQAQAAKQAAEVTANGLRAAYQATQPAGGSAAVAEVIEPATAADSDRLSYLGFLLVVAAVAGLAIGLALALVRANLQARRLLA